MSNPKSKFESLSNEILMIVFEHIEVGNLFYSFYNLNQRLNYLLLDHPLHFYCTIRSDSNRNNGHFFRRLYKDIILPKISNHIQSLTLIQCDDDDDDMLKTYYDDLFHFKNEDKKFVSLRLLTLDNLALKDMERILNQCSGLPNIKCLIIFNAGQFIRVTKLVLIDIASSRIRQVLY
ncbi:unnamed protein product [Didymodactylos carnosus]|uniref:F-box domain-containing protein n=1 Tax=Didymodactylos carnosus TaxID=1234261 RepID=A0A8S2F595_9BILA|nr:unnamed protein product [Didymodactylos carnosus]CAF4167871.1 unnamed protein product [Didymodactylos carnosus]